MTKYLLFASWPYYGIAVLSLLYIYVAHTFNNYWGLVWTIFALAPIVDQFLPNDEANPTPEEMKILDKQVKWDIPMYAWMAVETIGTFWSVWFVSTRDLAVADIAGIILTQGTIVGLGITVSHEMMHKKSLLWKAIGCWQLSKCGYGHFYIEHLYGHHKNVSTPADPASARMNQTVYNFLPQTIVHSFQDAWAIEKKFLAKKGESMYSLNNRFLLFAAVPVLITMWSYKVSGLLGAFVYILTSIVGILLLEVVNYIRHYGLFRKEISPGVYEQVTVKHSWNATQPIQNAILMKLQRHSDHHANGYKPYQSLCSYPESPQLPMGYAGCILCALFPSMWFRIINPLVEAANETGHADETKYKQSEKSLQNFLWCQVLVITAAFIVL